MEVFRANHLLKYPLRRTEVGPTRQMRQNNLRLRHRCQNAGKIVHVNVPARDRPGAMLPIKKSTLDQEHAAPLHKRQIQESADGRVARVGQHRDFVAFINRDALILQPHQFRARFSDEFRFQFVPRLHERETHRSRVMIDRKRPHEQAPTNGNFLEMLHANDLPGRMVALDIRPDVHEALKGLGQTSLDDHAARRDSHEPSLRKVIGDSGGVIHVPVGNAEVVQRDDFPRGTPHVEANVELRGGDDGFLAGHGETDQLNSTDGLANEAIGGPGIRERLTRQGSVHGQWGIHNGSFHTRRVHASDGLRERSRGVRTARIQSPWFSIRISKGTVPKRKGSNASRGPHRTRIDTLHPAAVPSRAVSGKGRAAFEPEIVGWAFEAFAGFGVEVMRCPSCSDDNNSVVDSRMTEAGAAIRRRRQCLQCGRRFTTKERVEEGVRLTVVKVGGRRVPYDRDKIFAGIERACSKLDVTDEQMEQLTDAVEGEVFRYHDREVMTEQIGRYVCVRLRKLNPVAYIRFMSVHRKFSTIEEFVDEVSDVQALAAQDSPLQQPLFES